MGVQNVGRVTLHFEIVCLHFFCTARWWLLMWSKHVIADTLYNIRCVDGLFVCCIKWKYNGVNCLELFKVFLQDRAVFQNPVGSLPARSTVYIILTETFSSVAGVFATICSCQRMVWFYVLEGLNDQHCGRLCAANCIMGSVKTVEVSPGNLQWLCLAMVSAANPSINTTDIVRHDCAVKCPARYWTRWAR
jgi:hypothetical protein